MGDRGEAGGKGWTIVALTLLFASMLLGLIGVVSYFLEV
jgi:hypothetical protein